MYSQMPRRKVARSGLKSSSGRPSPFCRTLNSSIRYSNLPAWNNCTRKTTDASKQSSWSSDSWMNVWRSSKHSHGRNAESWEQEVSFSTRRLLTIALLRKASMAFGLQNQTPRVKALHHLRLRRRPPNSSLRLSLTARIAQPPGQVRAQHRRTGKLRLKSIVRDETS